YGAEPYTFTFGTDQCGNYSGEGSCYNREHSFPKSWYNDGYPMYTDLVQLVPTDGYVNGMRGNLAYGEVDSPDWTSQNGSKKGYSNAAWATDMVFEPIDEYKGDFARIYFYMATRYKDEISGWEAYNNNADAMLNGTSYPAFESAPLAMLMTWHENDPVSQKEQNRNNAIYDWQGNRNPFVDHPEYVEYIWGDGPNAISENNEAPALSISPNPANDKLQLRIENTSEHVRELVLYDICGKPVLKQKSSENSFTIDVKKLPAGMYFLQIENDLNFASLTKRIVIR
ncbi:MAG: endonuclease, partial [Bacteroidales bacterium]